jgi:hypothetical protein
VVLSSTPASSTTKTGRHDIAEILLKVALNTIKSNIDNTCGVICPAVLMNTMDTNTNNKILYISLEQAQ